MSRMPRFIRWLGLVMVLVLSGCLFPAKSRTYENEAFSFTIPANWKTSEEVWNRSDLSGQDYYGLGVQEIVTIQYPTQPGKGKAFFSVAASRRQEGQDLESRIHQVYQTAMPEIKDETIRTYQLGELSGYEVIYLRPWGEPWWKFRDIWLEKGDVIYVLSFHTTPNSFDTNNETFEQILAGFQFKE